MKKTFHLGKIDLNKCGRKINLVTLTVELKENEKRLPVFSASACVWNSKRTDILWGGQCLDGLNTFRAIKNNSIFSKVYEWWKKYHLNDMHVGTVEQELALECWHNNNGTKADFAKDCEYLKTIGLYEVKHNGKLYKYGSGWIYREIPQNDLEGIKELF